MLEKEKGASWDFVKNRRQNSIAELIQKKKNPDSDLDLKKKKYRNQYNTENSSEVNTPFSQHMQAVPCPKSLAAVSPWSEPSPAIDQPRPVLEMAITHQPISQHPKEAA